MYNNFLIIIPTYNESENIRLLIDKLDVHGFHILVVDDNSPDNTFDIVKNHKNYGINLFGLLRTVERGYGKSVIDGFKYAIQNDYEYVIQMDADFSHRIEDLLKMCILAQNNDLVIGSRYVKGSSIEGWGLYRKNLSKYANLFAKASTKSDINDLTSGFRIYSKYLYNNIEFDDIVSNGYSFLVEIIAKIPYQKYKILEFPITFIDRKSGKSKMGFKIIFESIINLIKILFRRS